MLFDRFFRDARYVFSMTNEQEAYLKSLDELQVLCIDNDAPYSYQREDGTVHVHKASLLNYIQLHPVHSILIFVLLTAVSIVACSMMIHAKKMRKK